MSNNRSHTTRFVAVLAALLVAGGVAVGTTATASPGPNPSTSSTWRETEGSPRTPVPPVVLLTQKSTTSLDQPFSYPTEQPAQVSSSIITLLPGEQTGRHFHQTPMYAYILSGSLTVTYETGPGTTTVMTYRKGAAFVEAIGTWHNGANTGREPVRILVVQMGASGVANTVK